MTDAPDASAAEMPDMAGDPCGQIICPVGEICYAEACYSACETNGTCSEAEACFDGRCAEDACDGVQCPVGQICEGGSCFDPCADDDECSPPQVCHDARCTVDACAGILCPVGEICYDGACYSPCGGDDDCTPPLICNNSVCIEPAEPCEDVLCPVGEICFDGGCYPGCEDDDECAPPASCFDASFCADSACFDVQCPDDEICYEGSCYDPCTSDGDCTPPFVCFNNAICNDDPCFDVSCPVGEICYGGACYDPCANPGDCTPPQICFNNLCSEDPCTGLNCPVGEVCRGGECFVGCIDSCTDPNQLCVDSLCLRHPCDGFYCPPETSCSECAPIPSQSPATGSLSAAGTFHYTFQAQEGELITLLGTATALGSMTLYSPDYAELNNLPLRPSDAWMPIRIEQTGEHTVTFDLQQAGDFTLTLTRYGIDLPAAPPWHSESIMAIGTSTFEYNFFANADDMFAVDVTPDMAMASFGQVALERLEEPGVWNRVSTSAPGNVTSHDYESTPLRSATVLGRAPVSTIYRVLIMPSTAASLEMRYHKLAPSSLIQVDSTGMCNGVDTGMPRLAGAAIQDGGTIEICAGDHLENATIPVWADNVTIRGVGAAKLRIGSGFALQSPALFHLDGATGLTLQDLELEAPMNRDSVIRYENTNTNINLTNVVVTGPTSSGWCSVFQRYLTGSFADLTLEDVTVNGRCTVSVQGDDVTFRRFDWMSTYFPVSFENSLRVVGDRALVEGSTLGVVQGNQSSLTIGVELVGEDGTVRNNVISAAQTGVLIGSLNSDTLGEVSGNTLTVIGNGLYTHAIWARLVSNVSIHNNHVTNYADVESTVLLDQSGGTIVNNRLRGDRGEGIHYRFGSNPAPLVIANNTIDLGGDSRSQAAVYLDVSTATTLPVQVFNNLIKAPPLNVGTPTRAQCGFEFSHPASVFDYNLIDGFFVDYCGSAAPGSNDVIGQSMLDADLKLIAPNPAIDAGTTTGAPATDFEGDTRPNNAGVDIGADEH